MATSRQSDRRRRRRSARQRELIVEHGLQDVAEPLLASVRPSLVLTHTPAPDDPARATKLGGHPALPDPADWPTVPDSSGRPRHMPFLAQINLADLTPRGAGGLPETGLLSFFADVDEERATVRHFPDPRQLTAVPTPSDVPDDQRYHEVHLAMTPTWSIPDPDSDATPPEKDRDDAWHYDYIELHADLTDPPPHRVLGHPDLLQARLPGDPDHVLLLQVVGDEKAGTGWGVPGWLYVTIQPDDLRHRRWDRVVLHLQAA